MLFPMFLGPFYRLVIELYTHLDVSQLLFHHHQRLIPTQLVNFKSVIEENKKQSNVCAAIQANINFMLVIIIVIAHRIFGIVRLIIYMPNIIFTMHFSPQ